MPINASHHTGHCETSALRLSPLRTHVQAGIVSSSVRLQLSDMPQAHCEVTCLKAIHLKSLACQVLQNFKYLSVVILQTSIISSLTCCNEITSCCPHRWPIGTSGPESKMGRQGHVVTTQARLTQAESHRSRHCSWHYVASAFSAS